MILIAALLGATSAIGVWLALANLKVTVNQSIAHRTKTLARGIEYPRLILAAVVAVGSGALTRWPVAACAGFFVGYFAKTLFATSSAGRRAVDRSEAIASWTEMLRDTLAAGQGVHAVIRETSMNAPPSIYEPVRRLADRIGDERPDVCLSDFAEELANPTADLVAVALGEALHGGVANLAELLSTLARTARSEASMRMRVEAERAKSRTLVRSIVICTVGVALLLGLLNQGFLTPYRSAGGQVALGVVFGIFGIGLWWMARLARFEAPERFLLSTASAKREVS